MLCVYRVSLQPQWIKWKCLESHFKKHDKGRLQNPTAGWPAVPSGSGRLSLFRTIETGRNRRSTGGWVLKPSLSMLTECFYDCIPDLCILSHSWNVYKLKWGWVIENRLFTASRNKSVPKQDFKVACVYNCILHFVLKLVNVFSSSETMEINNRVKPKGMQPFTEILKNCTYFDWVEQNKFS